MNTKESIDMSNSSKPLRNIEQDDVEDINVITHYPKDLSDEMVVLIRRISYLKTKVQNINESQIEVLKDVSTFDDFITNLFLSKKTSISNYLRETDPYNPLIWSPSLDDDEDEDEVDDSYEVVKKSKKSKKK
jgi:hypothetical protein